MKIIFRKRLHPLKKNDEKGQSTIEFLLMLVVFIVTTIAFLSVTFLGSQALLTGYVSYTGARGYMAYSNTPYGDNWKRGVEIIGDIVPYRLGPAVARQSGDGVLVNIKIRELFPALRITGETGTADLHVEASLGTEQPLSGDNML